MDSDSSDNNGEYSGAGRGGAKKRGGGKKKFNEKIKCALCEMDFVGCEDPNLPTTKPCGCTFHEYCLYKASFYVDKFECPGKCRDDKGKCRECKNLKKEVNQLKKALAASEKKVEKLSKQLGK